MVVHQYYHRDPRVRRYAEGLTSEGVQVHVICPRDPDHPEGNVSDGVEVFPIRISRGYHGIASYPVEYGLAFVLYALRLTRLYIRYRYDVIHVHNIPDFLVFTALIPSILGAKIVLDIHDPMPEAFMSKYDVPRRNALIRFLDFQEQASTRFADAVLTANQSFKDNIVGRGTAPDKVVVINNLPDPVLFRRRNGGPPLSNDGMFTLLYPGTIAPRYGLDVAIRALPLLAQPIPGIRLVILGPQVAYVAELVKLAEQLDVTSLVSFRPAVPVDQVPQEMARADVGIYTARPNPHMSIAMPTKVLEFVMMGMPVVAARLAVLKTMFPESAMAFFEPGDSEEFAEKIRALFEDADLRSSLVAGADAAFVQKYSWAQELAKYREVLLHLTGVSISAPPAKAL